MSMLDFDNLEMIFFIVRSPKYQSINITTITKCAVKNHYFTHKHILPVQFDYE